MQANLQELVYEIELAPGEVLSIPTDASQVVGPGTWRIRIEPAATSVRDHSAFLNSYSPDDEGLYDDYPTG